LITINELLEAINKLQQVSDGSKFEMIARVLDEDKDGVIDYNEALKVKYFCIFIGFMRWTGEGPDYLIVITSEMLGGKVCVFHSNIDLYLV
jgi:hypothetical protein